MDSRMSILLVLIVILFSTAVYLLSGILENFKLASNTAEQNLTNDYSVSLNNSLLPGQLQSRVGQKLNNLISQPAFLEVMDIPYYDAGTVTAIIPVTVTSVKRLRKLLQPLLSDESSVSAITLIYSPEVSEHVDIAIRDEKLKSLLDISSIIKMDSQDEGLDIISAACQSLTEYVLIMDEDGLSGLHEETQSGMLSHLLADIPMGYCGGNFRLQNSVSSCLLPLVEPQSASFLLPPFVVPTALIRGFNTSSTLESNFWENFGRSLVRNEGVGVSIQESRHNSDRVWCFTQCQKSGVITDDSFLGQCEAEAGLNTSPGQRLKPENSTSLAIILPNRNDLNKFSSVACKLLQSGYNTHVLILSHDSDHIPSHDSSFPWLHEQLTSNVCKLSYSILHTSSNNFANTEAVDYWIKTANESMSVIIIGKKDIYQYSQDPFNAVLKRYAALGTTVIEIPQQDLPYCDWIGSLTLAELRRWNAPSVDITVITDNRPKSLKRLLDSLQKARYFGDMLDIRINIEQTADSQTRHIIDTFQWEHGRTFVHHRVVHAGLLTAIVESWYPGSNNSYGVLLEDDVEVSPLFYAWIKLCLLRYRYGSPSNQRSTLFGISLYQQKQIELRPEGRRPFDAQLLFDIFGLLYRNTPYLSQIPCSWGAVYFPEHWREFHKYLMVRFSEAWLPLREPVVPHVRSNRWSKSWKRFFIELVYLRGYVMLYPNYDDFISFSTNHLEIGSHVREQPRSIYDQKKALFKLPLMDLPSEFDEGGKSKGNGALSTGLLDLPGAQLPSWEDLPVLDLLGSLASEDEIIERGKRRQARLVGCETVGSQDRDGVAQGFEAEELFTCQVDKSAVDRDREVEEIDSILIHDDM